jgi:hypothetical protein
MFSSNPARLGNSIRRNPRTLLPWIPVAFFIAIVSFQLLGPTPVGMADNRDFARILGPLGVWPASALPPSDDSHSYFRYFVPDYLVTTTVWDPGIPSSEQLIALAAGLVSRIVLPENRFDLRVMGVIHALLMTVALVCFLRAFRNRQRWIRIASAVAILWIWTDVMYVQQFSTAYSDAGAVVALCLAFSISLIVLLTREGNSWKWAIAFALAGCFLVGTKLQHAPVLVPFAAFSILMAARRAQSWRTRTAWCATPVMLLATVLLLARQTPDDYRTAPAFTVVFYKLAVLSKKPDRVLAAFGMPLQEFRPYIGHYYYEAIMPEGEAFRDRIRAFVTPSRLASFYAHNPDVLAKTVQYDWRHFAYDVNLELYGDLREIDVIHKKASPEFNLWTGCRKKLFRIAPLYPIVFFGMSLLLCAGGAASRTLRGRFPLWPVPAMVTLVALSCFFTASLLDAAETPRHLVLFQAATDLTILSFFLSMAVRNRPLADVSAPHPATTAN